FDWRISLAQMQTSGDFSRFPGIDRHIMLIEGESM
ncbi:HutD family protein, partial [Alcaligenes pakistanensis]